MREPIDQYIIDQVYKIRKDRERSQQDIAIALGHNSNAYVGAIESMSTERTECYNNKQLNELAKYLKCSPKEFLPEKPIDVYLSNRLLKKNKEIGS